MPVVSALSPISLTQFFYASGKLVRPARLFFYKPQTEDLVVVYTDPTLGVPHEQPVLSGGSGRVPPVYVGTEPYRVRVYDTNGSHIEDIPYLPGAVAAGEEGGGSVLTPAEQASLLKPGDMFFAFGNQTTLRTGCVRANGGLIGRTGCVHGTSEQIERYNDDTLALFTHLWGQDHSAVNGAPVIPLPRGASSAADWGDGKAITLPDLRCRTLLGIDGMGRDLTARLTGVETTPLGFTGWSGVTGGLATTVQTAAQMPTHNHALTADIANVSLIASGTGIILNQLAHSHMYLSTLVPDRADRAGNDEVMAPSGTTGEPTPLLGLAATSSEVANVSLNDPWHTHTVSQTVHTHGVGTRGGGAAMPTISPFTFATVFIKL